MRKKYLYYTGVFFTLIITGFIFIILIHNKSERQVISTNDNIKSILTLSRSLIGNSTEKALQKAYEALNISKADGNKAYVIQSMELLSEIKNIRGETKQSLNLYISDLQLAENDNFPGEICKLTLEIGKIYYNWGQYDTSFIYFKRAFLKAEMINDKHLTSSALTYIGKYYRVNGNFEEAMNNFKKALDIARSTNDYNQIAFTLNTEGKYYIGEGNLLSALQCYQEAYSVSENVNDKLLLAEVCNHLGGIYLLNNQYQKSLDLHRKALLLRDSMDNPEGKAKSYNNIGKAYLELNKPDSALLFFKQSLSLCEQTGYKKGLVKALTNLGKVLQKLNELNESEHYLLQAFAISNRAGYKLGIAETSQSLGDFYKNKGSIEKAISFYKLSLTCLQHLDFDELLRINYQGLYECYNTNDDYKNALHFHELLLETEKKLLNVENQRQLAMLQIAYNFERKEKDNQVLRKDNELKEMTIKRKSTLLWLIVALLLSSILFCLYIYNRFYSKKKANQGLEDLNRKIINQNHTLETLNKELNNANDEKDKIFSIIAHELRNPLYWFQNLAEVLSKKYHTMSPDKIQKTLSALDESSKNAFHLMDNLLHWSRSKLNRITPKKSNFLIHSAIMETIGMYETILKHKDINLKLDITEKAIIHADEDLFNCIIRNLLTNAIKYTPANGTICIMNFENEKNHTIMVGDSGAGIPGYLVEKLFNSSEYVSIPGLMEEKGSGFGLKLCKEFVELHGGTIWLESQKDQGTQFFFTIPKILAQTLTNEQVLDNKLNYVFP